MSVYLLYIFCVGSLTQVFLVACPGITIPSDLIKEHHIWPQNHSTETGILYIYRVRDCVCGCVCVSHRRRGCVANLGLLVAGLLAEESEKERQSAEPGEKVGFATSTKHHRLIVVRETF